MRARQKLVACEARVDAAWAQNLADQITSAGREPSSLLLFYEGAVPFMASDLIADVGAGAWMLRSWKIAEQEQVVGASAIPLRVFSPVEDRVRLTADRQLPGQRGTLELEPAEPPLFPPIRIAIIGHAAVRADMCEPRPATCMVCGRGVPKQLTPEIRLCLSCFVQGEPYATFRAADAPDWAEGDGAA